MNQKDQPAAVRPKRSPVAQVPQPEESANVSMKEEELCQAFSVTLLAVEDIDEGDSDMPQLCSEYIKDIYRYLQRLEVTCAFSRLTWCWLVKYFVLVLLDVNLELSSFPNRPSSLSGRSTWMAMRSMDACALSWLTGWFRCTPGSSYCRRLCIWLWPSWIAFFR